MPDEIEEISIDDLPNVEVGPEIDLSEYQGQKITVNEVKVISVKIPYDNNGTYHEKKRFDSKVLKVMTEVVTTIETKDNKEVKIRASELFNLKKNEEGKFGLSNSKKAKIRMFMKLQNVEDLKSLIGTSVTIKTYESSGNTFLGFETTEETVE